MLKNFGRVSVIIESAVIYRLLVCFQHYNTPHCMNCNYKRKFDQTLIKANANYITKNYRFLELSTLKGEDRLGITRDSCGNNSYQNEHFSFVCD